MPEGALAHLALSVGDGAVVDWTQVESSAGPAEKRLLGQLRLLSESVRHAQKACPQAAARSKARLPLAVSLLLVIAAAQIASGAAGWVLGATGSSPYGALAGGRMLSLAAFAIASVVLLAGSARDLRALYLGGFFLLISSSFAGRLAERLLPLTPLSLQPSLTLFLLVPTEAFLPFLLARFVTIFPTVVAFSNAQTWARRLAFVSGAIGSLLFTANLLLAAQPSLRAETRGLAWLDSYSVFAGLYWPLSMTLVLASLGVMVWKARGAARNERRRVAVFLGGTAAGVTPMAVLVLLMVIPSSLQPWLEGHVAQIGWFLYGFLFLVPIFTAYAILVEPIFDVRLVVGRALRSLLARSALTALCLAPAAALAGYLYQHRHETLTRVASRGMPLALLVPTALGVGLLRARERLLRAVDRTFLREHYHSSSILARFAEGTSRAGGIREILSSMSQEIGSSLLPERLDVLLAEPDGASYRSWAHGTSPLPARSALVHVMATTGEPILTDLASDEAFPSLLPFADRQWLAESGVTLVVPMIGGGQVLVGILALGEKRSQLPYSRDDRLLLVALASAAVMAIEPRLLREKTTASGVTAEPWAAEPPAECTACGELFVPQGAECPSCQGPLATAALPREVAGKFRVERRVGRGGMGVVYRALDLELRRVVAIKTLPRLLPERAARLRREARAMASVAHPNLALLYGLETWRGVPMLVEEYLAGGTLMDRLRRGPLPTSEVVDLGASLADALATLHAHGLLHRDVKSSNVGFTSEGVPKLLDLGLAGILEEGRALDPAPGEGSTQTALESMETLGGVAGTPAYMSPEAHQGLEPHPRFDLWGLAVVLFEASSGTNPFRGQTVEEARARVLSPTVPSLRSHRPEAPSELDQLLRDALSSEPRRRPPTAAAFRTRLLGIRAHLRDVQERLAV